MSNSATFHWNDATLGSITEEKIPQTGPGHGPEFIYIDISSVDNKAKCIVGPKRLAVTAAPSRAKQNLRAGDVLVSMTRPNLNAVAVVPQDLDGSVGSTGFHILRAKDVEPKWVFYAVQTNEFIDAMCHLVQGALYPAVRPKDVRAFNISVPPRPEQFRIVAEIDKHFTRLEAGVAGLRRVQANLKRYRAAVLKAACEGKLVPTEAELAGQEGRTYETGAQLLERILTERRQKWSGKGKYKDPVSADTTKLQPLSESWAWSRLEQLGVILSGLTKNPKRDKLPRQFPYLRVANVYANELRLEEIEDIGVDDSELEKLLLRRNDLLVVEGNGSKDQIGRLAIWDGSIDPCVHQNHLIKVRPVLSRLAKWILYWLLSPVGRQFVETVASSTSGLYTLSVNKVGELCIALPPLAEQERIIADVERRLSVIEELEAVVNANLQRSTRLRQAILHRAFVGEISL